MHEAPPRSALPSDPGQGRDPAIARDQVAADQSLDPGRWPAATICSNDAGYELNEAQISPNAQSFRVLTGQEVKKHFELIRVDPDRPRPTIQKSQPQSSTTGLIHPYEVRNLTISEIKLMSSFPAQFALKGNFHEKWARIGNSVPPLFMRAIADHLRSLV